MSITTAIIQNRARQDRKFGFRVGKISIFGVSDGHGSYGHGSYGHVASQTNCQLFEEAILNRLLYEEELTPIVLFTIVETIDKQICMLPELHI